jgi:adenine phosphoribosyltransferase
MSPEAIKALVRSVPDFPRAGILFRDVTTLIGHAEGFAASIDWLVDQASKRDPEAIVGIEARGFIFGAPVAARLELPFVPVRKPGKLPVPVISAEYALEYGTDRLELDPGAIAAGQRAVLVDDLLATGGTAGAAARLVREAGGLVEHALFVIDLPDLGGSAQLAYEGIVSSALISFAGH